MKKRKYNLVIFAMVIAVGVGLFVYLAVHGKAGN